jgi:hypothetical protein
VKANWRRLLNTGANPPHLETRADLFGVRILRGQLQSANSYEVETERETEREPDERPCQLATCDVTEPLAVSRWEGRPVVRSPKQLRLHPALEKIGWTGVIDEFNDSARLKERSLLSRLLLRQTGRFSPASGSGGQ